MKVGDVEKGRNNYNNEKEDMMGSRDECTKRQSALPISLQEL